MRRFARRSPDSASVSMRERLTPTSANSAATKKPLRKTSRTIVNRYSAVSMARYFTTVGGESKGAPGCREGEFNHGDTEAQLNQFKSCASVSPWLILLYSDFHMSEDEED